MATAAEIEGDGPAIRALGALFTVSQIYLWDDDISDLEVSDRIGSLGDEEESTRLSITSDAKISVKQATDYCSTMEDLELACHMASLGLPVSFSTTKQRKVATSEKRKGKLVKSKFACNDIEDQEPEVSKVEQENYSFPEVLHDSFNLPASFKSTEAEKVASDCDALEEHTSGNVQFDAGFVCETAATMSEVGESEACDEMITIEHVVDKFQASGVDVDAENLDQHVSSDAVSQDAPEDLSSGYHSELPNKQDSDNTSLFWEFGDWRVIWDHYYRRNYFYNSKTQESTWYAPPGLEYFACSCSISTSNGLSADAVEQHAGFHFDCDADRDQDEKVMQAESDPPQENKKVINQTLFDSSAKANCVNCPSASCSSNNLDMITNAKEVSDNLILCYPSHIYDNTIDELDIVVPSGQQEEKIICDEALNVPDVSVGVAINNCLITSSNEVGYDGGEIEGCMMDELHNNHEIAIVKKKRRARRHQSQLRLQGIFGDFSANIFKYWCQRYSLFSRYDSGIEMDEEGWFSVTPEPIARHHATRCGGGIVIDCFAGVGGNAIQFAMKSNHVIAIDIDPQKVEFAYHNSSIYGVNDKIDFIQGDFFKMAAHLKGDTVFLSPPWGGPDYAKVQTYDIRSMLKPHDGYLLFKTATMIASKVVLYLPRNIDLNQLAELSLSIYPPWMVEVEKNILNGKFKAVTAYFSSTT